MVPSAIRTSEVLLVFNTLLPMDVKVLVPRMETQAPRGKARAPLSFKLPAAPGQFPLLVPRDKKPKQAASTQAGVVDSGIQRG